MKIQTQVQGAVTVLKPTGALIDDDVARFRTVVMDVVRDKLGRMVIDVSATPFVDSNGLELLLDAADELANGGLMLKLCGLNETLREVLDLTEIADQFEIYEDTNTAVRSFI